jgi:hypothetical protein
VVNHVAPMTVFSGAAGTFPVSGSDPNVPALTPLAWTVTQTGAPALLNLTITPTGVTTGNLTFTAPTLPPTQVTNTVIQLTITATNSAGVVSASEFTSVTVKPLPDVITPLSGEYRTGKQRLIVTASTTNANATLTLQPYRCEINAAPCVQTSPGVWTYNPDPAAGGLGNVLVNAGGVLTLDISGAPRPACNLGGAYATPCAQSPLDIKSNIGGNSGFFALTRIRQ